MKYFLDELKLSILRRLVVGIFYTLPSKFANIYLYLSIISLIKLYQEKSIDNPDIDMSMFHEGASCSYDDSITLLPKHTYWIFWDESFMNRALYTEDGAYPLRKILQDETLLKDNMSLVISAFINKLPKRMKNKVLRKKYDKMPTCLLNTLAI